MNFIILILGIWLFATIGAVATKNTDPYESAFYLTLFVGLGYLIIYGHC